MEIFLLILKGFGLFAKLILYILKYFLAHGPEMALVYLGYKELVIPRLEKEKQKEIQERRGEIKEFLDIIEDFYEHLDSNIGGFLAKAIEIDKNHPVPNRAYYD